MATFTLFGKAVFNTLKERRKLESRAGLPKKLSANYFTIKLKLFEAL